MKTRIILFYFILLFFLNLSALANAAPFLYNPKPVNGTFIYGRNTDEFAISIVESSFNTSSAKVFVRVKDPTSVWQGVSLTCINSTLQDWYCNTTVQGLESLVSDGKILLYYFEAENLQGEKSSNGTQDSPLEVLVDRSAPIINFLNIANQSYISNNKQVLVEIKDVYSGLNISSALYLLGNETWNSTWQNLINISFQKFRTNYDVLQFSNNTTAILYVEAKDMVGNQNVTKIYLLIDNELPTFDILSPIQTDVYGTINLTLKVYDNYSQAARASFVIQAVSQNFSCSENICSTLFDTSQVPDGNYSSIFTVWDNAENSFSRQLSLKISNTIPVINLLTIKDNSYISGIYNISYNVENIKELRSSEVYWKNTTYSTPWYNATCINLTSYYYCYFLFNTTMLKEGTYELQIKAVNEVNMQVFKIINIIIDNTKPILSLGKPFGEVVNGTFIPTFIAVDDYGLNDSSAIINLSTLVSPTQCSSFVMGKKLVCAATFDTTKLADGDYDVIFQVKDLAGNQEFLIEKVKIKNPPFLGEPVGSEGKEGVAKNGKELPSAGPSTSEGGGISKTLAEIFNEMTNFMTNYWYVVIVVVILIFIVIFLIFRRLKKQRPIIIDTFSSMP
ncbi:MAG: Ig-like domain-containing protein [Candidatus Aenigmatarchaeota archaeon]